MADYYQHHIMWYTVYDAKTGDLIASGTSEMCARRLGYRSSNVFASAAGHRIHRQEKPGSRPGKYIIDREVYHRPGGYPSRGGGQSASSGPQKMEKEKARRYYQYQRVEEKG